MTKIRLFSEESKMQKKLNHQAAAEEKLLVLFDVLGATLGRGVDRSAKFS